LVPGVQKCVWQPCKIIEWNGLKFDFDSMGITILHKRIESSLQHIDYLLSIWPKATYREIAKCVGQLGSMYPVFCGLTQIKTRMLQTFVNIRHYRHVSWGENISADYKPLYEEALGELLFGKTI
jgi:hypothetical protein